MGFEGDPQAEFPSDLGSTDHGCGLEKRLTSGEAEKASRRRSQGPDGFDQALTRDGIRRLFKLPAPWGGFKPTFP